MEKENLLKKKKKIAVIGFRCTTANDYIESMEKREPEYPLDEGVGSKPKPSFLLEDQ